MAIAVLHHLENPFLGNAAALGEVVEFDHRRGDGLPALGDVDAIVVLGGEQSAWEPQLQDTVALLGNAVDRGVPVLGVCLGAQLLARALGAEVTRSVRAVEWRALTPVVDDPLLAGMPVPVPALHFNEDVFALPAGAVELFERVDPASVEAFRYGDRAWGIQFHPDTDEAELEDWLTTYSGWIPDPDALRAGPLDAGRTIFENFGRLVS